MKRRNSSVFAFCIAVALFIPQNAAAQSFPTPAGEVFRQEGIASWYGAQFEGRPTASGEIFDSSLFTAAHPTLPFGTFVIVTNRNNNRQVSVRINDRGPFVEGRIIDVSRAAAEHLGMIVTGTAPVIIETISAQAHRNLQAFPQQQAQPQQQQQTPAQAIQQPVFTQPLPQQQAVPQQQAPAQAIQQQPVFTQPLPQQQTIVPIQQPVLAQPTQQQVAPQQQHVVSQAPVQQQGPVRIGTTTIPLDVPANVPITINIFHTPNDLSQPMTVVVSPESQPVPNAAAILPNGQPPARALVEQRVHPNGVIAAMEPQAAGPAIVSPPLAAVPNANAPVETAWQVPQTTIHEEWWQLPVLEAAVQPLVPQPLAQVGTGAVPVMGIDLNGTYRVQVGSFRVARNAVDTFVRLRAADFDPSYERSGEFFRVVLAGISGTEVQSTIERLAVLGHYEVVIKME